jgi:membrane-associated phospholipid phosphatase
LPPPRPAFYASQGPGPSARPPAGILLKPVTGPSFPSGHATQAVAVYGMLAALAAAATSSWARKVTARALALVITGSWRSRGCI